MASFFGSGNGASTPTKDVALRVQSSLQGKPIPILWGQTRIAGNLIWENDFRAIPASGAAGGKGGVFGAGSTTGYEYLVNIALAICEGPVASINSVWKDQAHQTLQSLNLTTFLGTYTQTAWGLVSSLHPTEARNYRGLAYVAAGPLQLGSSSSIPNLNYEVKAAIADGIPGLPDADPSAVVTDFLTNAHYGLSASFPVGDLTVYSNYARAMGLVVSPALTSRTAASAFLRDLLDATNSEAVWSSGALKIVPYGDQDVSANGATYTAPFEPEYDLTEDDFLPGQSSDGPVVGVRKRQSDSLNQILVEFLDATSNYNPAIAEAKDDAAINDFGLRSAPTKSFHLFCNAAAAGVSASLLLGRQAIRNEYTFTLGEEFVLLEPMDIVSLTDIDAGLSRQWVRILDIQENADFSLTFTAEEYLAGTAHAPHYGMQANTGRVRDFNADPGSVNTPVIFEPTGAMIPGPEVWLALSGAAGSVWGGAEVWYSWDNTSYAKAGTVIGPAITGVLAQTFATVAVAAAGPTVDQTNICHVDLSSSGGELTSSSLDATLMLDQLCFVDGEFISFQNAKLVGTELYDLTYMVRGAFDPENHIVSHAAGSPFTRVDDRIFRFPYTPDKIGATLYLKFLSFNLWGGGTQQLSDVGAYQHVIGGTWQTGTLGSTVTNFNVSNVALNGAGGLVQPGILCTWDPVSDKTVKSVVVSYNIKNDTAVQQAKFLPGPGVGTISGVHPATIYQLKATIDVTPSRPTTFTSTKEITTGATQIVQQAAKVIPGGIDNSQFAADLAATIALVTPTHLLAVSTDILANSTASTVTTLQQTVTSNYNTLNAAVVSEAALRVTNDSALSATLDTLTATVNGNFNYTNATITNEQTARASGDAANATTITNLTTTVNGHSSTLQVYGQSIDGLNSEFGVTIAFDNVIGGFKLTGIKQNATGSPVVTFLLDGDFVTNGTITGPKIKAGQISASHVGTNLLVTNSANIGTATINTLHAVGEAWTAIRYAVGSNVDAQQHTNSVQDLVSITKTITDGTVVLLASFDIPRPSKPVTLSLRLKVDGNAVEDRATQIGIYDSDPGGGGQLVACHGGTYTAQYVATGLSNASHTFALSAVIGDTSFAGGTQIGSTCTLTRPTITILEPKR